MAYPELRIVYFANGRIERVELHTSHRRLEVYERRKFVQLALWHDEPLYSEHTVSSVGEGFYSRSTPKIPIAYKKMPHLVRRVFSAGNKAGVDAKVNSGELTLADW